MKTILYIFIIFSTFSLSAQERKDRLPTYFGLQVRSVFPTQFIGSPVTELSGGGLEGTMTQKLGISFGGTVRASITKLIAFETGINFTQRNFDLTMGVPDSNSYAENDLTFIEYDIPINALIYIQLSDQFFMNASLGAAITYKPTDVSVQNRPDGDNEYTSYGLRRNSVGADLNANLGFEFRTRKSGFFYLGGSARVPFVPLFDYALLHKYDANINVLSAPTDGSYLTLDLKYFFPLIKNKGPQFESGPIE